MTKVVLIQLFSLTVVSKQKVKMKTWNTMAPSYHSALLKIRESHLSLVWLMEFSIISPCLGKVKVFLITPIRDLKVDGCQSKLYVMLKQLLLFISLTTSFVGGIL